MSFLRSLKYSLKFFKSLWSLRRLFPSSSFSIIWASHLHFVSTSLSFDYMISLCNSLSDSHKVYFFALAACSCKYWLFSSIFYAHFSNSSIYLMISSMLSYLRRSEFDSRPFFFFSSSKLTNTSSSYSLNMNLTLTWSTQLCRQSPQILSF